MDEDFKEACAVLMIICISGLIVLTPFILCIVYAISRSPEQICAEQQVETDFCKSLLNNPNLILKK